MKDEGKRKGGEVEGRNKLVGVKERGRDLASLGVGTKFGRHLPDLENMRMTGEAE